MQDDLRLTPEQRQQIAAAVEASTAAAVARMTDEKIMAALNKDQLARLRIAPILAGVRGEPPVDLQVVARAAVALGRYAAEHADRIASIDLNPLIAGAAGQGGWAVDAVIERKEASHG